MLCCQDSVGLTHGQALYVLMKRMVQVNIKRQNYQTSVKNVILLSSKTVSSNITPVVNWKGNRIHNILAIKVAFLVYILFLEFSAAFAWCEEWVIVVQTILW